MARAEITLQNHTEVMKQEIKSPSFWRDVMGEIVASFFLMSVQCSVALSWGRTDVKGGTLQGNLSMGALITVLCEVFGQFGGANMNPAVSISFVFAGRSTALRALVYTAAQLLGVSAGAAFTCFLTPAEFRETLALTQIRRGLSVWQGLLSEVWVTTLLLLTVYGSSNSARRPVYMNSVIVGFYVFVAGCAGAEYSGASMNPARSFGPALVMNMWKDHWVYWFGPILGGILGAILFRLFFDNIGHPLQDICEPHIHEMRYIKKDTKRKASKTDNYRGNLNEGFTEDNSNGIYSSHM